MAYGLKFTHTFFQLKGYSTTGEYKVEIYLEGYGGASSEFKSPRGSINMKRGGDLLEVIQATTLSVGIYNTTEGLYKEFRDAAWGDYKVILIQDPNGTPKTKFIGYNQSEVYSESGDQPPYTTMLSFTCGLSHLKHVRWDEEDQKITETGKNTNSTATVSASVLLTGASNGVRVKVDANSGDHSNHIIKVQISADDIVWVNTDWEITGAGFNLSTDDLGNGYVRLKVSTAEGSASTVDWEITPIYTGQKAIIEVLRLALNKLPSPLNIREIVNVYEDNINNAVTESMISQIFVTSEIYKELEYEDDVLTDTVSFFCNEVIEEMLRPFLVSIYQWDGLWYIIRTQEYGESTLYYREFNPNIGTENTITVDATGSFASNTRTVTGTDGTATELVLVAPASELSIEPPLNRVKVTYNQSNLEIFANNLIGNGNYDYWEIPTPSQFWQYPSGWYFTGVDYTTYQTWVFWGQFSRYFRFEPVEQATAASADLTKSIYQIKPNINIATVDSLLFSFDFMIYFNYTLLSGGTTQNSLPTFFSNDLFVKYPIKIRFGIYYLDGNPTSGYSWTTVDSVALFEQVGMSGNFGVVVNNYREVVTISTLLPTLPANDSVTFEISIYRPYTNLPAFSVSMASDYSISLETLAHRAVTLTYLPNEVAPEEELVLYQEIDEDENVEEIESIHGDGSNTSTVNSYRLANGVITDVWARRGTVETEGVLQLLLLQLRDLRGEFKRNFSAKLIGEFDVFNTIEDTTDVTTEYYIKEYDWAVETNEWSTQLMEIITSVVTPTGGSTAVTSMTLDTTENVNSVPPPPPPLESKIVQSTTTAQINQVNLNGYI